VEVLFLPQDQKQWGQTLNTNFLSALHVIHKPRVSLEAWDWLFMLRTKGIEELRSFRQHSSFGPPSVLPNFHISMSRQLLSFIAKTNIRGKLSKVALLLLLSSWSQLRISLPRWKLSSLLTHSLRLRKQISRGQMKFTQRLSEYSRIPRLHKSTVENDTQFCAEV
jgi:hypothetical protein